MSTSTLMDQGAKHKIAQFLSKVLSDTYVLYVKTQNFHWNVVDPRFFALHKMLDEQYHNLAESIDEIAERIRALESKAPGSMQHFLDQTSLMEADNNLTANVMLHQLIDDHTAIANLIRPWIPESQKYGDEATGDLLIERLRYHEKTAWMLRSHFVENH